jgi:hypothetical protein
MKAVYSSTHLLHDAVSESINGRLVPAHEVAERAELIRSALMADGGFELVDPTKHGKEPILTVTGGERSCVAARGRGTEPRARPTPTLGT